MNYISILKKSMTPREGNMSWGQKQQFMGSESESRKMLSVFGEKNLNCMRYQEVERWPQDQMQLQLLLLDKWDMFNYWIGRKIVIPNESLISITFPR